MIKTMKLVTYHDPYSGCQCTPGAPEVVAMVAPEHLEAFLESLETHERTYWRDPDRREVDDVDVWSPDE